jgi:hypothetical protein
MKTFVTILSVFIIVGCSKPKAPVKFDPNKKYYMEYQTNDQLASLSVRNDTLRINFHENISLLVDPTDYNNSWAIHLKEDFSQSYLKDLHFNALAWAAGYMYDWVPVNLDDAAPGQVTATNTTVNGKNYVKVTITRVFEFFNKMGTAQAAQNQLNVLLQTTNQSVTYKMFYSDGIGYSISNDGTFKIIYSNQ